MGKKPKSHGPRYGIKRVKKAWVTRDKSGKFKKWTRKKRSLASDKVWKAPKATRRGTGNRRDW
jgi:hypothetical protein